MNETQAVDAGDLRKYRTEIPNVVFTLGLSPFEVALYCHLKKTAGADGKCWKSTKTLAAETKMSGGQISAAKEELSKPRPELGGKSLINIQTDESKPGRPRHVITIVDIWPENFRQSSPGELQSSYSELQSSPGEPKNKPREERTRKETPLPRASEPAQVASSDNGQATSLSLSDKATPNGVTVFEEVYEELPHLKGQADIEARVTDLDLWRRTLRRQKLNGTPPKNVGTLIEIYEERLASGFGSGGQTSRARAAPSEPSALNKQDELRNRYNKKVNTNAR